MSVNQNLKFDKARWRVKLCPCGKSNRDGKFVPYVGYEDKGYCHSCERTFLPMLNKDENNYSFISGHRHSRKEYQKEDPKIKTFSTTPKKLLKESRNYYDENNFILFLMSQFEKQIVEKAVLQYNIGSYRLIAGSTLFWQIDQSGNIRGGKIMLYDYTTGKRIKEPYAKITWVHSCSKQIDYNLQQCFFGEHLLSVYPSKQIAIVESEKSATIASMYFPQFNWIASGGCHLSENKLKGLSGRDVILFPDADKYNEWTKLAKQTSNIVNATISDFLEIHATDQDKKEGMDIADYLLCHNLNEFKMPL